MKTYRIWKRLVVLFCFFIISCSGVSMVSTRICSHSGQFRRESGGVFTCVYILININRSGQSSDSGVSGHRGSTVKRIFGEVKMSSLWWICYWSCDKVGETLIMWPNMGRGEGGKYGGAGSEDEKPPNKSPGRVPGTKHFSQTCPKCIPSLNSGPEKHIYRLYKYMYA